MLKIEYVYVDDDCNMIHGDWPLCPKCNVKLVRSIRKDTFEGMLQCPECYMTKEQIFKWLEEQNAEEVELEQQLNEMMI
jgi:uncharacterized Zn finger protein (UPF0148 family)